MMAIIEVIRPMNWPAVRRPAMASRPATPRQHRQRRAAEQLHHADEARG
jgi:hypothetical protein